MNAYFSYARTMIDTALTRLGVDIHNDRGMTTLEATILTAALAAVAIAAGLIIWNAVQSNAEAIPNPAPLPGG